MPNRIKDFSTTATAPASDDFVALDGTTNGSRKISGNVLLANISTQLVQPTGTINGTNTAFTLPVTPAGDVLVLLNGLQVAESGYTVSATTLTMTTAPQTGDRLDVAVATLLAGVQREIGIGTSLPGTANEGDIFGVYTP
jgi:hypothetical protein